VVVAVLLHMGTQESHITQYLVAQVVVDKETPNLVA
jgi:hypothetical protein